MKYTSINAETAKIQSLYQTGIIVKGPFNITWGNTTLYNVKEIEVDYKTTIEDSNQTLTYFTEEDLGESFVILPQYYKGEVNIPSVWIDKDAHKTVIGMMS